MQSAFDQERYAAQLANYYQSIAEQDTACAQQENEQLHQTIWQQSVLHVSDIGFRCVGRAYSLQLSVHQ